jgi:hypothetical protein
MECGSRIAEFGTLRCSAWAKSSSGLGVLPVRGPPSGVFLVLRKDSALRTPKSPFQLGPKVAFYGLNLIFSP